MPTPTANNQGPTSGSTGLFMHQARAPEISDHAPDQRYFGGQHDVLTQHGERACTSASVMRFVGRERAHLDIHANIFGLHTSELTLKLSADECRLLACALLDAEHDLRTVAAVVVLDEVAA